MTLLSGQRFFNRFFREQRMSNEKGTLASYTEFCTLHFKEDSNEYERTGNHDSNLL